MASTPVKVTAAQENANGYLRDLHLVAVVGPDGTPISGGGGGSGGGVTTLQPGVDRSGVTGADKPFRVTEVLAP